MVASLTNHEGVSIIIPIYNIEQYIHECLQSAIGQTYANIEIILVDDGSTDKSGEIAEWYAAQDKRVQVIHKKNGGLSDARNAGIRVASFPYIIFIDSDDYVADKCVETALLALIKYDADIVCFGFEYTYDNMKTKLSSKNTEREHKTYTNIESIQDIFTLGGALKVNSWNKIYKRSLFSNNEIFYPTGRIYEDNLTTYKLMFFAKKVVYIDKVLYSYRQRSDSIMKGRLTNRIIKERYSMLVETVKWLNEKLTSQEVKKIQRLYRKTLLLVLTKEAVVKKQIYYIPSILFQLIVYNTRSQDE